MGELINAGKMSVMKGGLVDNSGIIYHFINTGEFTYKNDNANEGQSITSQIQEK